MRVKAARKIGADQGSSVVNGKTVGKLTWLTCTMAAGSLWAGVDLDVHWSKRKNTWRIKFVELEDAVGCSRATSAHLWRVTGWGLSATSARTRASVHSHVCCAAAASTTSQTWRHTCAATQARSPFRVTCAAASLASRWPSSSTCRRNIRLVLNHSGVPSAQQCLRPQRAWSPTCGAMRRSPSSPASCAHGLSSTAATWHATWSRTPGSSHPSITSRGLDCIAALPWILFAQWSCKQMPKAVQLTHLRT
ncbi:uncharacterized protein LOC144107420 isoform X2 [Amblyomma americanum]